MEIHLETIRAAVAEGATAAQRQAGAAACRALYAALSPPPGVPLSVPHALPPRVDVDQVLDVVIARLRSMVPDATATAAATGRTPPLQIPLIVPPGQVASGTAASTAKR
ncbi:MAG: hypothetical protein KC464_23900 [Myxococcales bacterium]|nr:hypothetical protein [Myxococcales bacterium]